MRAATGERAGETKRNSLEHSEKILNRPGREEDASLARSPLSLLLLPSLPSPNYPPPNTGNDKSTWHSLSATARSLTSKSTSAKLALR